MADAMNAYSGLFYATGVTPAMDSRSVGEGSQYLAMFVDAKNNVLDGGKDCKLHLPPNVPIKIGSTAIRSFVSSSAGSEWRAGVSNRFYMKTLGQKPATERHCPPDGKGPTIC